MWLEHTRRHGWKAVAAVETDDRRRSRAHAPPRWTPRRCSASPTATAAHPTSGGSSRWSQGLHRVGVPTGRDHRPDEQLLRADRAAHPSARPGPRPRRGAGPAAARRPRRGACAAVHPGDQRRGQPGLAAVPPARASPTSSAATTSPATRGPSPSWAAHCRCSQLASQIRRVWHDTPRARPIPPQRLRALALLLLFVAPLAVGCVRVHASITVSPDDRVSGQIVAAAKARDDNDKGPQFDSTACRSARRSRSRRTTATTTSAPQAVFSDLTLRRAAAAGQPEPRRRRGRHLAAPGRRPGHPRRPRRPDHAQRSRRRRVS